MTFGYAKKQSYDRSTVDKATGEMREERVTEVKMSSSRIDYRATPYGTLSDAAWELMDVCKFTNNDRKLLGHLIRRRSRTEHGMTCVGSKKRFAAHVGMSLRALHRSFAVLEGSGFIYPLPGDAWMLNPRWMFNGNGEAHQEALRKVPPGVPDLFHLTSYGKVNNPSSWDDIAPRRRPQANRSRRAA
ncbi:hypothetical protein AB0G79_20135 [Streptomyces sp. NPDC020807]|uniref:hypothetical protein n=1 Tax=Streptomyces sp. NPDC020807 TaxID=3155119 RepID=UPI003407752C